LKEYFNSIIYYNISQRTRIIILTIIVTVALALRLSYIGIPALDRTSWKETDYIEISKNFTKNNFNILEPTITWPAENPRVTAMEFPIVPYAASRLYKIFGFSPLTVRLITLVAFLILIIYLEKLTAIFLGRIISLLSAFFVSIIPVFHGYGNFGVLLMLTGMITLFISKKGLIFLAYFAAILSFFIIVAEGNIDGMYRHLTIVPPAAVMISAGTITLPFFMFKIAGKTFRKLKLRSNEKITIKYGIVGFVMLFVVLNISKFDKSKINVWQIYEWKIACEIKKHLTDGNKIITLGNYSIHKGGNDLSPVLYYYSGTTGWSLQKKEWDLQNFDKFREKGAQMIVCLHIDREDALKDFVRKMEKKFRKVYEDKSGSAIIFLFN